MKSRILAIALFVITATTVFAWPLYWGEGANARPVTPVLHGNDAPIPKGTPRIEAVFVLDTTGSMGGLIQAAKEKIWSIATTMASAQPAPEIRLGLVAYRDRGDDYVTRIVDLSADLDSVYAALMDFQAAGGGDGPESVNQALHEAVNKVSWSQDQDTYKVVFLVGDAPPHMDYPDDIKYPETIRLAGKRGIVVNAIQCGLNSGTKSKWVQIASLGGGKYFQVGQAGSAVAVSTPYDEKLASLSARLDATRLYYGSAEEKVAAKRKIDSTDKLHAAASVESRARRAAFNASKSGERNAFGEGDLVEDVTSGRVELDKIAPESLPPALQTMAPEEQKARIGETAEERKKLRQEIQALAKERSNYLRKKVEESGAGKGSLDDELFSAVKDQAKKKGLVYAPATAPAY